MTTLIPRASARPFAPLAAGLALFAGCASTPHFSEQDLGNLTPQGRAFVATAAEHCQVKPLAVLETLAQRPVFLSVVQDTQSGAFAAVFARNPLAPSSERIIMSQDDLLQPERMRAMAQAIQKPGQKCVTALVDFQNTKRAVSGIIAAQVVDFLRKLPERPNDDVPWFQPKPLESAI